MDDADLFGPLLFVLSVRWKPQASPPFPTISTQLTSLLSQYGTFLLLSGKIHFGYIYGLALLGSTSLHIILSLMTPTDAHPSTAPSAPQYGGPVSSVGGGYPGAPDTHHDHPSRNAAGHFSSTLTFTRSSSVLGYCLLPLVATSVFGIFMPMDTPLGIVFTTMAILWCTYSASGMFCAVGRMRGMRGLVAYPLALFYVGFGIMGIFSSRGSGGSLAKAAAGLKG